MRRGSRHKTGGTKGRKGGERYRQRRNKHVRRAAVLRALGKRIPEWEWECVFMEEMKGLSLYVMLEKMCSEGFFEENILSITLFYYTW
jgi:hypothetical protein